MDNQMDDNDPVMQMISKLSILSRARVQLMKNDIDANDVIDKPTLHMLWATLYSTFIRLALLPYV